MLVTSHAFGRRTNCYINSWKRAISHGGGATDKFTDDLESGDAGNNISTIIGPKVSLNGRLCRKDRTRFDADLKEFTKIHVTMRLGYDTAFIIIIIIITKRL